jgi:hypothetical protein
MHVTPAKKKIKTRIYTILSMSTKIITYRKRRETNASFSATGERQHLIEQTNSENNDDRERQIIILRL